VEVVCHLVTQVVGDWDGLSVASGKCPGNVAMVSVKIEILAPTGVVVGVVCHLVMQTSDQIVLLQPLLVSPAACPDSALLNGLYRLHGDP
jgi:hypothetical protein